MSEEPKPSSISSGPDGSSQFTNSQGSPVIHVTDTVGAVFLGILSTILLISLLISAARNRRLLKQLSDLRLRS
jgi:hypothetical protein